MFLLIDGQAIQSPGSGQRGIGRYSRSLVRAIATARPEWRIEVVQNGRGLPLDSQDLGGLPVVTYMPPTPQRVDPPLVVDELAVNELHYADWLTAQGADAVLLTSMIACEMEAVVPRFGVQRPAVYAILYDLIPLLYSDRYLQAEWQRDYYAQRMQQMSATDALFAISQTSADDFADHFPNAKPKVLNIRGAVDRDMVLLSEKELSTIATKLRSRINIPTTSFFTLAAPIGVRTSRGRYGALRICPCIFASQILWSSRDVWFPPIKNAYNCWPTNSGSAIRFVSVAM